MKNVLSLLLFWSSLALAESATVAVEQVNLPLLHPLAGRVEAVNQATMTAQTSGRIAELYFDVNDLVKKGEPLARLRNEQQKAEFDVAQAEHERAQAEFNRINDLYQRKLVALALLDQARAMLKTATARLSSAQENFDYTIIRAPYSEAYSINDHGAVVGTSYLDETLETSRAFIWTRKGGMQDLNALVDLPDGVLVAHANGINDFGWIAGTSTNNLGFYSACLLIPYKIGKEKKDHRYSSKR